MNNRFGSSYGNEDPYIPQTLSEIYDLLGSMVLNAPTFTDDTGYFPERNIGSRFHQLTEGFGMVREKVGEEHYAALMDRAARAKALFAADPEDANGKTDQGRPLLHEIEDIIQSVRRRRVVTKQKDDEGEVTGD
ncbi:hypothetical protein [Sphingomonas quercus]|uniref:Uncharacterized protein n=1 Tax=Sphingomonas quercus TaxID=2842451 RepID=A0ABS6BME2_9SPHN|nr:hypothetical protein [Sphingomonas quercus]MBU3078370.1 hypothetical protein [Sphingomonas quercus]